MQLDGGALDSLEKTRDLDRSLAVNAYELIYRRPFEGVHTRHLDFGLQNELSRYTVAQWVAAVRLRKANRANRLVDLEFLRIGLIGIEVFVIVLGDVLLLIPVFVGRWLLWSDRLAPILNV